MRLDKEVPWIIGIRALEILFIIVFSSNPPLPCGRQTEVFATIRNYNVVIITNDRVNTVTRRGYCELCRRGRSVCFLVASVRYLQLFCWTPVQADLAFCSGQYQVADLAKCSEQFRLQYGNIVKLSGLVGRPDLLFVYDADATEKVYRAEGPTPYRPSMPCLVYYKSVVRKDFFGALPGVVGV